MAVSTQELIILLVGGIFCLGHLALIILGITFAVKKKSLGFSLLATTGFMFFLMMGVTSSGSNFDPTLFLLLWIGPGIVGVILVIVEHIQNTYGDSEAILVQQPMIQQIVHQQSPVEMTENMDQSPQDEISEIKSAIDALNERLDKISSESED
tara:strand:+ start:72 stop:530 length:459 start_codon:yes stop_codon:yes gene_type:complete